MKPVRPLAVAIALIALSTSGWAAQNEPHKAHHPAGSGSAAGSGSPSGKTTPEMAIMANQMKAMHEMHDKMMAAKTPEARSALMAEHMKTMQAGMDMMKDMGGMGGMGAMGARGAAKPAPADMARRQMMMEQRLDMMQSMMEMMVDRLPQSPAKP